MRSTASSSTAPLSGADKVPVLAPRTRPSWSSDRHTENPMTTPLSVVLIHRNDVERAQLRGALEALPGVEIAGERADLRAGVALAHQAHPAILVLELAS